MIRTLPALLLLLAACTDGDGGKDDSGPGGADSGDSGGTDTYAPGCILVDGAGGYALLQDAVTVAEPGATITLCDGTYPESVVVDKTVTIRGDSQEGVILSGQGTTPALEITGDLVKVENLTVTATYSGIVVDGADGVVLSGLIFDQPAYWGLQLKDALNAEVRDSVFLQPGGGGIEVNGGMATIDGVSLDNPSAYGISVVDGAAVTLTGSSITGTIMTSDDVSDGYGVNVVDSSLVTDGNVIQGVDGVGVWADTSALTLRNDTIASAGFVGIFGFDAAFDIEGLTISDAYLQGAYLVGPTVRWVSNVVTAQPDQTCSMSYDDWGDDGQPWCGGALLGGDSVTVEGGQITGYNNYGMYIGGYSAGGMPATVSDLGIRDVGRWGLYLSDMETTVSGLSVTGIFEPELPRPCEDDTYIYLDRSVSVLVVAGTASIASSNFTDNDAWGISSVQARVDVNGSHFNNQACSSLLNYQGAATVSGNSFTGGQQNGQIWDYEGATIIDGNTFTANHYDYSYEYKSGGTLYGYTYSGYSIDVYGYSSSELQVTNNTFVDGDQGVVTYFASAEVTGNTWDDYGGSGGALLYAYQPASSAPPRFADNAIGTFGGYLVLAYYGDVEVEDVTVEDHTSVTVNYVNYVDGVETSSGSYTSSANLIYAYGSSSYPSTVSVDGLQVTNAEQGLVSTYDATVDLKNIEVDNVGGAYAYAAVSSSWSSGVAPNFTLEGLSIGTATGAGVTLSSSYSGAAYVTMSGLDFDRVTGTAVQISSVDGWTLSDSVFGDVGSYGVYSAAPVTATGTAVLDGVEVNDATGCGIYLVRGGAQVTDTTVTGSSSGLCLYSLAADVTLNHFTGNTNYGMECSSVTLNSCASNDLTGNGSGEHSGCDDACGVFP